MEIINKSLMIVFIVVFFLLFFVIIAKNSTETSKINLDLKQSINLDETIEELLSDSRFAIGDNEKQTIAFVLDKEKIDRLDRLNFVDFDYIYTLKIINDKNNWIIGLLNDSNLQYKSVSVPVAVRYTNKEIIPSIAQLKFYDSDLNTLFHAIRVSCKTKQNQDIILKHKSCFHYNPIEGNISYDYGSIHKSVFINFGCCVKEFNIKNKKIISIQSNGNCIYILS